MAAEIRKVRFIDSWTFAAFIGVITFLLVFLCIQLGVIIVLLQAGVK